MDDLNSIFQRGLNQFGGVVDVVGSFTRSIDNSIKSLDDAMRGSTPPPTPDQAFSDILTHLTSMQEMARGGFANTGSVAQKARVILSIVNQVEPPWKERPSSIRTHEDMLRIAIRDLRGSQALLRLASARGTNQDIEGLIVWMNTVSQRVQGYPRQAAVAPVQEAGIPGMPPARGVSTEATIAHQHKEIKGEMVLLEKHLTQGCKVMEKGKLEACDCCEKHVDAIYRLTLETQGITVNPLYTQIIDWCRRVEPITTTAASKSGEYDAQYPKLATELRELRKSLMAIPVL